MSSPIWNVPFRRNPFFTGRENVLNQLHILLQHTHIAALSQPVAMSGLGGIGKTQTAVEYAYRYKGNYQVIWWVKSSTLEELAEDFASLAQQLNLEEQQEQEQARIITAVKQWFETHSHWLLIFDNADDLTRVYHHLPQSSNGHILITTRAHAMGGIATKIEMQTMDLEEGTRLLLQRAGLIEKETPLEQVTQTDLNLASDVIQELGGLPLALDQAGAYIEETEMSLSMYLNLYKQQRADLLKWRGGLATGHAPVATTWTLAFQNLEESEPAAIELIRLCAFLAPDTIPEDLLTNSAHLLPTNLQSLFTNQTRFNQAIAALLKYSLIQRDRISKTLSIHRLVQAVIKDQISKTQQAQWAEHVVHMVNHLFPKDEVAPWTSSQRYLPHVLLAVEYCQRNDFIFRSVSRLFSNLGIYFVNRGQYNEAEPLLQHSLTLNINLVGPTHPDTASALGILAILYTHQGKYEQAEPLYQRALTIQEQRLGPTDPNTAITLNNLANLYTHQGKYEQAEPLYQRALTILKQRLGPTDPDTASYLNNLANLYTHQGKYEQAEPLYQRALTILKQRLGSTHPDTATTLDSLANLYTHQGKYEQAEPLYQRALTIREQRLGSTHPDTATTLNSLANLYTHQGKYEQAEPLYQRALAIYERMLGPEHPDTKNSQENYASFQKERKQKGKEVRTRTELPGK